MRFLAAAVALASVATCVCGVPPAGCHALAPPKHALGAPEDACFRNGAKAWHPPDTYTAACGAQAGPAEPRDAMGRPQGRAAR